MSVNGDVTTTEPALRGKVPLVLVNARSHLRLLFLLTVALVLAEASFGQVVEGNGQASWKEYTYPNDGFAITFPSEPSTHKDAQFPDLQINVYTSGGVTLRAEVAPNGCDSAITSQAEGIEHFKTGQKKPNPGFQLDAASVRQGSLEGHPFLEFEQTVPNGMKDFERWYCVEKKLYVFSSVWPAGQAKPATIERVVRSFRLLKKS